MNNLSIRALVKYLRSHELIAGRGEHTLTALIASSRLHGAAVIGIVHTKELLHVLHYELMSVLNLDERPRMLIYLFLLLLKIGIHRG